MCLFRFSFSSIFHFSIHLFYLCISSPFSLSLTHFFVSLSLPLSPPLSLDVYIYIHLYILEKKTLGWRIPSNPPFFFPDETGTRPLRISMKLVFHTPFAPRHLGSSVTSQAATNATGAARDQVPNLVPWPCAATP